MRYSLWSRTLHRRLLSVIILCFIICIASPGHAITSGNLGLNPFPFLLTVMFAASTAFLTPIGNHTNLMVYGPGGYDFHDFFTVGGPLQLLLAIVTPVAISFFWPLG